MKIEEFERICRDSGLWIRLRTEDYRRPSFDSYYQPEGCNGSCFLFNIPVKKIWSIKDLNELTKYVLLGSNMSLSECVSLLKQYRMRIEITSKRGGFYISSLNYRLSGNCPISYLSNSSSFENLLMSRLLDNIVGE